MKHYLITISVFDGEFEYWEKTILELEDKHKELDIIRSYTGDDTMQYDEDYRSYMSPYSYRGYRVYSSQEIDEKIFQCYASTIFNKRTKNVLDFFDQPVILNINNEQRRQHVNAYKIPNSKTLVMRSSSTL